MLTLIGTHIPIQGLMYEVNIIIDNKVCIDLKMDKININFIVPILNENTMR